MIQYIFMMEIKMKRKKKQLDWKENNLIKII